MEENETLQGQEAESKQPMMSDQPATGESTSTEEIHEAASEAPAEAAPKADATPAPDAEPQPDAGTENEAEATPDYSGMSREELTDALRELMNEEVQKISHRTASIRDRFNDLNHEVLRQAREAFLAAGGEKEAFQEQNDSIADTFYALYDQYKARRQQYLADIEEQKKKNLAAKQAIIEELRQLVDSNEMQMRTVMDKYNDIQERWKAIGDVPRESMNDLWQSYHHQLDNFFKKREMEREARSEDQKRNLEQKTHLCEQAEELIVETSVQKAFKALQELRTRWKEVGPVAKEQSEEIWQRFQAAANQIDQRRREYYEQRKEEFDNNLLAKQALIDKAVELTAVQPQSAKEWNDLTTALDELLTTWKAIGPVPREANEEIWSRFKGIIDKHYAGKKEFFGAVRDEQNSNYQKKLDLCLKAEAIAKRDDWKRATEEILKLQEEWKAIGPTSRKVSEKVWQRFRTACDEFFKRKGEFFKERRSSEGENLEKKEAILRELKEHTFGDNKEENLDAIKDFQRRWAEVGYVPVAEKERLQKEFRAELDRIFEQLKISAREAEEEAYRERLRTFAGDAGKFLSGERQTLQEKIEKLKADIALWDNNLGFLASSKQAELLKQEFERKMQGARQQLALLQAKLRILAESERTASSSSPSEKH